VINQDKKQSSDNSIFQKRGGFLKSSVIIFSILVLVSSTFLNIFTPNGAGAAGEFTKASDKTGLSEENYDWQIKSYLYYKAISSCMEHSTLSGFGGFGTIDNKQVSNGNWFNDEILGEPVGVYMQDALGDSDVLKVGDDGKVYCSEALIKDAVYNIWGFSNGRVLLCNSGFYDKDMAKTQSVDECINGTGNLDRKDFLWSDTEKAFSEYIKKTIYGGKEPRSLITSEIMYKFYLHSIDQTCIPGINIDGLKDTGAKDGEGSRTYEGVTLVNGKGKMETGYYLSNSKDYTITSMVNIGPLALDGAVTGLPKNLGKMSCKTAVGQLGIYAASFATVLGIAVANGSLSQEEADAMAVGAVDSEITTAEPSCTIGGVGWIVCPISNFLAGIADGAFHFISGTFLEIKPEAFNTSNSTYDAWSAMRNIANVLFVIVFLVIVFSQMSGFGITNYGVKKMLPRLIVAAILVNVSYFICQLAIDVSNIVGYSLDGFLKGLVTNTNNMGSSSPAETGTYFTSLVAKILGATGGLALAALSLTIPMIIGAVVALVLIVFLLVARQAIVILLVVVAPIAFVAYLLPNTNSLFKQWKKIFTSMLLLFPIVALVFGGSSMAASILGDAFTDSESEWIGPVVVAAINVLPLFAVPIILKKSLNSVGNIGATLNGLGDKLNGFSQKQYEKSNLGQYSKYRASKKELDRISAQSGNYKGKNPYRRAVSGINKGVGSVLKTGVGGKLLKNYAQSAESRGALIIDNEFEDEVKQATASQKQQGFDLIQKIASGEQQATEAERTAAIRTVLSKGNYSERKEVYKSAGAPGTSARQKKAMEEGFFAKGDNQFFGAKFASEFAKEEALIEDATLQGAILQNAKNITQKTLVDNADATTDIFNAIAGQPKDVNIQAIIEHANNLKKTDSLLHGEVTGDKVTPIDNISKL
jgi:hypothetical protein